MIDLTAEITAAEPGLTAGQQSHLVSGRPPMTGRDGTIRAVRGLPSAYLLGTVVWPPPGTRA
jgi:hypothetical protein